MRIVLGAALVAAIAGLTYPTVAQPTEKGFELCNRTGLTVVYAKALTVTPDEERAKGQALRIITEGWFDIGPGNCQIIWPGALQYRHYLIYAEARASNRKWAGNVPICVQNGRFEITNVGTCGGNKNRRMFIEVDTGDHLSYTYDLR